MEYLLYLPGLNLPPTHRAVPNKGFIDNDIIDDRAGIRSNEKVFRSGSVLVSKIPFNIAWLYDQPIPER